MSFLLLRIRTWYKIHKWTALIAGIALLMWLVTGITLTWRQLVPLPEVIETSRPDYRAIELSPAEAAQHVAELRGEATRIERLEIVELLGLVVFKAHLENGDNLVLDGVTGELIEITPELAVAVAKRSHPEPVDVTGVQRIDFNSASYPHGPVPVYEVSFDDRRHTRAYVSANSGDVSRSERGDRTRTLLGSLHTFDFLRLVTDRGRLITGLLILASLVALFIPILGYYLAFPRRWQVLNRRR